MDEKLKKLLQACLDFVNDTNQHKGKTRKHQEMIGFHLIEAFGDDLERDANTGKLVLDAIDDEKQPPNISDLRNRPMGY